MRRGIVLSILCLASFVYSMDLDIYGYYEPQLSMVKMGDKAYNLASNKLRVDIVRDLSDRVSFGANFNYITYHGKTEWDFMDYLPSHIAETIPDAATPFFVLNFGDMVRNTGPAYADRADRIFLDNAWVRLAFDRFDLTVGKQQLGMGTGYTWNPTDVFNSKDILDPTYEQPGHNAIKLDMPLGSRSGLVAVYAVGEEWKDSVKLLKLKSRLGHFDFSMMGAQKYKNFTDYTFFSSVPYKQDLLGGDIVGELFGLGLWAEGAYNMMSADTKQTIDQVKDHWEWIAGVDYTFESGLYMMGEFYHNDMAKSDWHNYTLQDWMWMYTTELKTLSRDQFSGLVQYPATDLITIGMSAVASVNDGSAAVIPMVMYSIFEDMELTVFGNFFTGQQGRTYATNMGNGGLARLRVYF